MKSTKNIISENRNEAITIVNNHGGEIEFIKNYDDYDFEVGIFENIGEVNAPVVIMDFDGLENEEVAVMAVRTKGYNADGSEVPHDTIEGLLYSLEIQMEIGWYDLSECNFDSENEVYEYLEKMEDVYQKTGALPQIEYNEDYEGEEK